MARKWTPLATYPLQSARFVPERRHLLRYAGQPLRTVT